MKNKELHTQQKYHSLLFGNYEYKQTMHEFYEGVLPVPSPSQAMRKRRKITVPHLTHVQSTTDKSMSEGD